MEVGLTIKFAYDLSWLGNSSEVDNALACLYVAEMNRFKHKFGMRIIDFVYEKDKLDKLHVHAHVRLDKKIYDPRSTAWRDRYETFRLLGFNTKLEHASRLPGWKKYMLKDYNTPGKYFQQGVWPSPAKEGTMCQHASDVYHACIKREIEKLEKYLEFTFK